MRHRTIAATVALAALAGAAPAQAHVTLQPNEVPAGGFTRLDVRVPNERDEAGTTKVEVQFPPGFESVSTEPKPGWRAKVTRKGEEVDTVSFTATGDTKIGPGEFVDFGLSLATPDKPGTSLTSSGLKPVLSGVASGAFFALSAIGFRGAILSLGDTSAFMRASTTLVWSLGLQTGILLVWLGLFDRNALAASFRAWRPSLAAGFLGALASQLWFIGFALTTAANVRTLALVEVLMAQAVSHRFMAQSTSWRELAGMALILCGVGLLLLVQH